MSWRDLEAEIREEFDAWSLDLESVFLASSGVTTARAAEYARAWRAAVRRDPARWYAYRQRVRAYQREHRERHPDRASAARARYRARVRADKARRDAARAVAKARREGRVESGPLVPCACGCGVTIHKYGRAGNERRFAPHHAARRQGNTRSGILALLSRGPMSVAAMAEALGKSHRVLSPAVSKLRRLGRVMRLGRGWLWALTSPVAVQQALPIGVVVRLDTFRRSSRRGARPRVAAPKVTPVLPGQLSLFDEVAA